MNLPRCLPVIFAVMLTLVNDIDGGKARSKSPSPYFTKRFRDTAQAINYLKENLPAGISFEEQCKRYAVLADMALSERFPYRETVLYVAEMNLDDLNKRYGQLDVYRISYAYMLVIDRYRVTQLAPPMMDIIACLIQIDTPEVVNYLNNRELVIISLIYKQVLESPDKQINLENLNLRKTRPVFRATLVNLFRKYFDIDSILGDPSIGSDTAQGVPDTTDPLIDGPSSSNLQSEEHPWQDARFKKQLRPEERREMDRLKQLRRRTAYPELREKNRLYQEKRRQLMKRKRESASLSSQSQIQETEAEKIEREKREHRNEKRRLRYRQLQEQRAEQRQLSNQRRVERLSKRVQQYSNQRQVEQLSKVAQQYALQISSEPVKDPQPLHSISAMPKEQIASPQLREYKRPRPLVNPIPSFPSFSQPQDQWPYSPSLPSPFHHVLRQMYNSDNQTRHQKIDSQAQIHIYPGADFQNRPAGLQLQGAHLTHQEPTDSAGNTDEFMQYLLDEPQKSQNFDDPSEAMSSRSRSPEYSVDKPGTKDG